MSHISDSYLTIRTRREGRMAPFLTSLSGSLPPRLLRDR
jgi:hypothetical protein